jgi:hypothetical protein
MRLSLELIEALSSPWAYLRPDQFVNPTDRMGWVLMNPRAGQLICSTISASIKAWAPTGAAGFNGSDLPDGLALTGSVESRSQK